MRLTSTANFVLALLLVACGTGKTNLGDLETDTADGGETDTTDGIGSGCTVQWHVTDPVRDGDWTTAHAVLALDDGFVLGATPSADQVTRVDADGVEQWTTAVGGSVESSVKDVILDQDGGYVVSIHEIDVSQPSRRRLRVARLSSDGAVEWSVVLGAAHYMAWMEADVLLHPDGGTVVSWHDSQDDGLEPRLVLARLDAQGQIAWSVIHPLAPDSPAASSWAHGAAALLGDGSILQLTTEGPGLRLVRTAADGSSISDAIVDGVEGSPTDLVVRPDGSVLLLATSAEVMVIEVEPDGTVLSTQTFSGGEASFGDVMAWDPTFEALIIGGTARDPDQGAERPWTLVVDGDGNVLYDALELDEPAWPTLALDVARIPSGGFVVSRHGGSLYYETVLPCAEG